MLTIIGLAIAFVSSLVALIRENRGPKGLNLVGWVLLLLLLAGFVVAVIEVRSEQLSSDIKETALDVTATELKTLRQDVDQLKAAPRQPIDAQIMEIESSIARAQSAASLWAVVMKQLKDAAEAESFKQKLISAGYTDTVVFTEDKNLQIAVRFSSMEKAIAARASVAKIASSRTPYIRDLSRKPLPK